jgi:hypothetical protein
MIKTLYYPDGSTYTGTFLGEFRHGQGTMTYSNGDRYTGQWYKDSREGHGEMNYKNGDIYKGDWWEDKKHGTGTMAFENSKESEPLKYEGKFEKGDFSFGKMTYVNGDVYIGEWDLFFDHRAGKGKMTYINGNVYEGEWRDDSKEGRGIMTYASGDIYDGQWDSNKRKGKGKMTYASGDVYKGDWVSDKRHGKGKMTYVNGDVYEGKWKNDKTVDYNLRSKALTKLKISPLTISPSETGEDIIDGSVNIKEYLEENPDNLLLVLKTSGKDKLFYYTLPRNSLSTLLDTSKRENSIVFVCKDVYEYFATITRKELVNETPFFSLRSIGIYNYVRADEMKSLFTLRNNQVFYFEERKKGKVAKSVVSWSKYKFPHEQIPSSLSCNPGDGGPIYDVYTTDVEFGEKVAEDSKKKKRRVSEGGRKNKNRLQTRKKSFTRRTR